jgi:hypothetical protein
MVIDPEKLKYDSSMASTAGILAAGKLRYTCKLNQYSSRLTKLIKQW